MNNKKMLILAKDPANKTYKPTACPCQFNLLVSLLIDVTGPHNFSAWINPTNHYVFQCRTALTLLIKDSKNITIYSILELDEYQPDGPQTNTLVMSHVEFMEIITNWGELLQELPDKIYIMSNENGDLTVTRRPADITEYQQGDCTCKTKKSPGVADSKLIMNPRLKQRILELELDKKGEEFKMNEVNFFPKEWTSDIGYKKIDEALQSHHTAISIKNRFGKVIRKTILAKTSENMELHIIMNEDWSIIKTYPSHGKFNNLEL